MSRDSETGHAAKSQCRKACAWNGRRGRCYRWEAAAERGKGACVRGKQEKREWEWALDVREGKKHCSSRRQTAA
ncbi:hypothetical protein BC628DRAFT_779895 [Trametes gibbosa]|nr:hypothetical protein BC628DRAFT_779895 [Trametes gibbosa]